MLLQWDAVAKVRSGAEIETGSLDPDRVPAKAGTPAVADTGFHQCDTTAAVSETPMKVNWGARAMWRSPIVSGVASGITVTALSLECQPNPLAREKT